MWESERGSEQTVLGEGIGRTVADDEVIEDADVDEGKCLFQAFREEPVSLAGFGDAGRVVVGENHGSGVFGEGLFDDLARVDRSPVDGAAEQLLGAQHPVLVVEKQAGEDFVSAAAQPMAEVLAGKVRAGEGVLPLQDFLEMTPGEFQHSL